MSLSSFSLILGVWLYAFGFPLVFCGNKHLVWRTKILKDENILRLLGTAFAALAAITLRHQWQLTSNAAGIVVLFAWTTLLKSLFAAWWPRQFVRLHAKWERILFQNASTQIFVGFVMVLLAAFLTYLGLIL